MPDPKPTPESPKVDVLAALLKVFTIEELRIIARFGQEIQDRSGYGELWLKFEEGSFRFVEPTARFRVDQLVKELKSEG